MLKILAVMFSVVSLSMAQDLDTLLGRAYKALNPSQYGSSRFHFECYPITLFPFFVLDISDSIIGEVQDRKCTSGGCGCLYTRKVDIDGNTHLLIVGLSYYLHGQESIPSTRTYRLFFYVSNKNGQWVQEKEPLTIIFDLVNWRGLYAPRLKTPTLKANH